MDPRTQLHITTALENQQFAEKLLDDVDATPAARRWMAVAAFYAAVHYVNAYLWEVARLAPHDHRERHVVMERWPALGPALAPYERLTDAAHHARYLPGFRLATSTAMRLIRRDLTAVERVIMSVLR